VDKAFCTIDEQEWTAEAFYALPTAEIQSKNVVYCVPNVVEMHGLDGLVMEMMHRIFVPITRKTAH